MELLKELVSLNSISTANKNACLFIERVLKRNGFKTQRIYAEKHSFSVAGVRGKSKRYLFLNGHVDTVPVYPGWKTDPFKLTIKGNRAYGLGIYDMKAGLSAILELVQTTDIPLKVFIACDEELEQETAEKLYSSNFLNDVEEGISTEPMISELKSFNKLGIGRKGDMLMVLELRKNSSHVSMPDKSIISIAAKIISDISSLKWRKKHVSTTIKPVAISSDVKAYTTPYKAKIMFRVNHWLEKKTEVEKKVRKVLKKHSVKFSLTLKDEIKPFLNNKQTKVKRLFKKHFKNLKYDIGYSVADENIFSDKVKMHIFSPKGGNAHSPNEYIDVRYFKRYCNILRSVATSYY